MVRAAPLLLVLAGAIAVAQPADERTVPREEARALFLKRCSACHDPSRVYHRTADRDEWREIVERMRRMPQSGISRADAAVILDYLVSLGGPAGGRGEAQGGREVYGEEWLSVLETAAVRDGRVRIGGEEYEASRDGATLTLRREGREHVLALPSGEDAAVRTSRVDAWRVGDTRYEVHLILYRIRGEHVRVGRALRRLP